MLVETMLGHGVNISDYRCVNVEFNFVLDHIVIRARSPYESELDRNDTSVPTVVDAMCRYGLDMDQLSLISYHMNRRDDGGFDLTLKVDTETN